MIRTCLFVFALTLGMGAVAQAEDAKPAAEAAKAAPAAAEGAKADVKACTGIESRMPTGEGTSFKAKETVYVWSEVSGMAGKEVEHVWKRDGKEVRRAKFSVGAKRWRMNSRQQNAAKGAYQVEVVAGDQKLGEVTFTVE